MSAKVRVTTVARFEAGDEARDRTFESTGGVFEKAGIEFISENGVGSGIKLRKRAR